MLKLNISALMKAGFTRPDVEALQTILNRSGITDKAITAADNQKQFEEEPLTPEEAARALTEVDELRGEMQAFRNDLQGLGTRLDELQGLIRSLHQTIGPSLDEIIGSLSDIRWPATLLDESRFAGPNQNLSGNGAQLFPKGLSFKWGTAATDNTGTAVITFPEPFGVACFAFKCEQSGATAATGVSFSHSVLAPDVMTVYASAAGTNLAPVTFDWFAIGKEKT